MSSKTAVVLEEKIKSKLISAEENRVEKLNSYLEKLKEHVIIDLKTWIVDFSNYFKWIYF